MRSPATLGAILALTLAAAPAAHAQSGPRLGLEVTGGMAFPVGDNADNVDNGTVLGANLLVQATPAVGVYAGYSRTEMPVPLVEQDLELQGWEGGVRLSPGLMLGPVSPTLTLGATWFKPDLSGKADDDDEGSDREVGWRAGLGFDIPLGNVLTASLGGSWVSHPFGDFPQCPPSKPNCLSENMVRLTAGLRVYPPLGR
jgi:hypothetical protein